MKDKIEKVSSSYQELEIKIGKMINKEVSITYVDAGYDISEVTIIILNALTGNIALFLNPFLKFEKVYYKELRKVVFELLEDRLKTYEEIIKRESN